MKSSSSIAPVKIARAVVRNRKPAFYFGSRAHRLISRDRIIANSRGGLFWRQIVRNLFQSGVVR